eukprot:gene24269-9870_t
MPRHTAIDDEEAERCAQTAKQAPTTTAVRKLSKKVTRVFAGLLDAVSLRKNTSPLSFEPFLQTANGVFVPRCQCFTKAGLQCKKHALNETGFCSADHRPKVSGVLPKDSWPPDWNNIQGEDWRHPSCRATGNAAPHASTSHQAPVGPCTRVDHGPELITPEITAQHSDQHAYASTSYTNDIFDASLPLELSKKNGKAAPHASTAHQAPVGLCSRVDHGPELITPEITAQHSDQHAYASTSYTNDLFDASLPLELSKKNGNAAPHASTAHQAPVGLCSQVDHGPELNSLESKAQHSGQHASASTSYTPVRVVDSLPLEPFIKKANGDFVPRCQCFTGAGLQCKKHALNKTGFCSAGHRPKVSDVLLKDSWPPDWNNIQGEDWRHPSCRAAGNAASDASTSHRALVVTKSGIADHPEDLQSSTTKAPMPKNLWGCIQPVVIATYNVLSVSCEDPYDGARTAEIIMSALQSGPEPALPDVVCLQEFSFKAGSGSDETMERVLGMAGGSSGKQAELPDYVWTCKDEEADRLDAAWGGNKRYGVEREEQRKVCQEQRKIGSEKGKKEATHFFRYPPITVLLRHRRTSTYYVVTLVHTPGSNYKISKDQLNREMRWLLDTDSYQDVMTHMCMLPKNKAVMEALRVKGEPGSIKLTTNRHKIVHILAWDFNSQLYSGEMEEADKVRRFFVRRQPVRGELKTAQNWVKYQGSKDQLSQPTLPTGGNFADAIYVHKTTAQHVGLIHNCTKVPSHAGVCKSDERKKLYPLSDHLPLFASFSEVKRESAYSLS